VPVHVTSHAHASRQSISLHAPAPLQVIPQRPEQLTLSHEPVPEHVTMHDAAWSQSISLHRFSAQVIVQFQPDGHVTLPPPPSIAHVIAAASHEEQVPGHPGGCGLTTQYPSMQDRMDAQSDCTLQARSSVACSIEQPLVSPSNTQSVFFMDPRR
jgi:hypothetical protein